MYFELTIFIFFLTMFGKDKHLQQQSRDMYLLLYKAGRAWNLIKKYILT